MSFYQNILFHFDLFSQNYNEYFVTYFDVWLEFSVTNLTLT